MYINKYSTINNSVGVKRTIVRSIVKILFDKLRT